jgi:hypothetical protein
MNTKKMSLVILAAVPIIMSLASPALAQDVPLGATQTTADGMPVTVFPSGASVDATGAYWPPGYGPLVNYNLPN